MKRPLQRLIFEFFVFHRCYQADVHPFYQLKIKIIIGTDVHLPKSQIDSGNTSADDAFSRLFASFESQIDATLRKSEVAAVEKNRATVVALNAEVRRMKGRLLDELPKLQKLAQKKVKGLSKEEQEARIDLVLALPERIQAIPDGSTTATKQTGGWAASSNIKFDSDGNLDSDFFQQSEEGNQFRQEYETRKLKQDQGLDVISDGLDVLKNLAKDMNEELDRQVPLIDEIDTKVDKATSDIKNTNVRLKATLYKYTELNPSEYANKPHLDSLASFCDNDSRAA